MYDKVRQEKPPNTLLLVRPTLHARATVSPDGHPMMDNRAADVSGSSSLITIPEEPPRWELITPPPTLHHIHHRLKLEAALQCQHPGWWGRCADEMHGFDSLTQTEFISIGIWQKWDFEDSLFPLKRRLDRFNSFPQKHVWWKIRGSKCSVIICRSDQTSKPNDRGVQTFCRKPDLVKKCEGGPSFFELYSKSKWKFTYRRKVLLQLYFFILHIKQKYIWIFFFTILWIFSKHLTHRPYFGYSSPMSKTGSAFGHKPSQ